MELGKATKDEKSNKPSVKTKLYNFSEKIKKLIYAIIIIIVVVEGFLIVKKLFGKVPDLRMCWDRSTCTGYCATESQKQCINLVPLENRENEYNFNLLLKGKITIIEFFNKDQEYCYCGEIQGEAIFESFYDFYIENK
jgi:hypothetical protein